MGIDPGTNYMGYGVLEVCGREVRSVVLGDIDLHRMNDPYEKLRYIFERVGALVDEYRPREVALESPSSARTCSRCSSWAGRKAWRWLRR